MSIRVFLPFTFALINALSFFAGATEGQALRACALLRTSYYSAEEKEDIQFYCSLPEGTRNVLPWTYWLRQTDYHHQFLKLQPTRPQAQPHPTVDLDDRKVSAILNHPSACQFYSTISPSVQHGRVREGERLKITASAEHMLSQCQVLKSKMDQGQMPVCSVIELAGHSTQAVGLDTVIGIDYTFNRKQITPELGLMTELSACLQQILVKGGGIVTSTCGGERDRSGQYHYWKYKAEAQQELSNLLGLPIISPIGPVHFASKYGPDGVEAVGGWTLSYPDRIRRQIP